LSETAKMYLKNNQTNSIIEGEVSANVVRGDRHQRVKMALLEFGHFEENIITWVYENNGMSVDEFEAIYQRCFNIKTPANLNRMMPEDKLTLIYIIKNPPYKNEGDHKVIDYEEWEKCIKAYLRKELE